MKKIYTMKSLVKNLMLAAMMVVGVSTSSAQATSTDETTYTPVDSCDFWMGEAVKAGDFYLYNVGAKIFATNNTPSEKSINKAAVWTVAGSKTYTFKSGKNNIHMEGTNLGLFTTWSISINTASATEFTLQTSNNTTGKGIAYKFSKTVKYGISKEDTRYFNIDNNEYSAAKSQSNYNDWILISAAQKDAYKEYDSLYTKAANILTRKDKEIDIYKTSDVDATHAIENQLKDAMAVTTNYTTYSAENGGKVQLEAAIKAAKDFSDTTTGIEKPATADNATVSEIYSINGVRNAQLTKGINIVKMSNGTVKKVIVK